MGVLGKKSLECVYWINVSLSGVFVYKSLQLGSWVRSLFYESIG